MAKASASQKDDTLAIIWYMRAAEHGCAQAQAILGSRYASGRGVERDYTQAMQWFQKAAAQDLPAAISKSDISTTRGGVFQKIPLLQLNGFAKLQI